MKDRLTDRKLQSLKPKRQRYDLMDTDVPGFRRPRQRKGSANIHSDCPLSWKLQPHTKGARRIPRHKP